MIVGLADCSVGFVTGSETAKTGGIASPVPQTGNWNAVAVKAALDAGFVKAAVLVDTENVKASVAEHAGTEASGVAWYLHVEVVDAGIVKCTGAQHAGTLMAAGILRSVKTEAVVPGDVEEAGAEQVSLEFSEGSYILVFSFNLPVVVIRLAKVIFLEKLER